ncbi:hypothetical protein DPMN_133051 [Dreissena polymorpha]|uniref:THD domain-containing protein n=1 Tax=Dreissena polymorpha TaxID=45954 RepID=A0A9D4FX55_DREPO|nr:hypothetical protein DPMN_133051 [Dreissena polymorpha]
MAEYGKLQEIRSLSFKSNSDLFDGDTRSLSRRCTTLIVASVVVCVLTSAVSVAAAVVCYKAWTAMNDGLLNTVSGTSGFYMYPQQSLPTTHKDTHSFDYMHNALTVEGTRAPVLSSVKNDKAEGVTAVSQLSDADKFDSIDNDHVDVEEEEEEDDDDSMNVDRYGIKDDIVTTLDLDDDVEYADIDSFEILEAENDEEEDIDGSDASGAGDLETGSGAVGQSRDGNSELKTRSRVSRSAAKPKNKNKKKDNKNTKKMTKLITDLEAKLTAMNASFYRDLNERLAVLNNTFYQTDRPSAHYSGNTGIKAAHFEAVKADKFGTEKEALRIFDNASWVEEASSPVTYSKESGQARVKEGGLFLVYAMGANSGNKTDKYVSIQTKSGKNGNTIKQFYCQNGVYQASGLVTSLQSCFVQGMVMLSANDVIEIHGRHAEIQLGYGTYFGVIQLSRRLAS